MIKRRMCYPMSMYLVEGDVSAVQSAVKEHDAHSVYWFASPIMVRRLCKEAGIPTSQIVSSSAFDSLEDAAKALDMKLLKSAPKAKKSAPKKVYKAEAQPTSDEE